MIAHPRPRHRLVVVVGSSHETERATEEDRSRMSDVWTDMASDIEIEAEQEKGEAGSMWRAAAA